MLKEMQRTYISQLDCPCKKPQYDPHVGNNFEKQTYIIWKQITVTSFKQTKICIQNIEILKTRFKQSSALHADRVRLETR